MENKKIDLSKIEAVFSDIDGTLLNTQAVLDKNTIEAINNLPIPFYLASGRYYKMMLPLAKELNLKTPLISANGGLVINQDGTIIKEFPIDHTVLKEILDQLYFNYMDKIGLHLYDSNKWYCNSSTNTLFSLEYRVVRCYPDYESLDMRFASSLNISKFLLFSSKEICDELASDWIKKYSDKINIFHEKDNMVEIFSCDAFKGAGVKEICKDKGYDINNVLCAGDTALDLSMLEVCGYPVAMLNATDALKKKALIIADHTNNCGLAKLLNEITKSITDR